MNLAFCLLDTTHKIECPLSVAGCVIVQDFGTITMSTGNAGGGNFYGDYRWFEVRDRHGQRQNIYIAVFGTMKTQNDPHWGNRAGRTTLYYALEEKGTPVSRLQIQLDTCLKQEGSGYRLTHNGARSQGKIKPLEDFVRNNCPELLGNQYLFDFGWLDHSTNLILSDKQTANAIGRSISYLLLRSELRSAEKRSVKKRKTIVRNNDFGL